MEVYHTKAIIKLISPKIHINIRVPVVEPEGNDPLMTIDG